MRILINSLVIISLLLSFLCFDCVVQSNDTIIFSVHFINVGQGDAILINCGKNEVLIDAGGDKQGDLSSFLSHYVDGSLEYVIITHPHADHICYLPSVFKNFPVSNVYKTTDAADSSAYDLVIESCIRSNTSVKKIVEDDVGDTISISDNTTVTFKILNYAWGDDINENSIVLELDSKGAKFLFMGDAGKEAEAYMMSEGLVNNVDILKVGHHGSKTASSKDFLSFADPEVAIYTAGVGNSYGLPDEETIDNIKAVGATVYGTDTYGNIGIYVTDSGYSITTKEFV
jgi:competence protein ComEC